MAAVMWSVVTQTSTLLADEAKPRATDGAAHVVYDAKRDTLVFVEQHHLRVWRHTGSVEVLLKPRGAVRALLLDAASGDLLVATDFAVQRLRRDDTTSRGYAESLEPWVGDAAAVKGAFADGSGNAARFGGITALAWDRDGTIVVSDAGNYRIRTVTPAGAVSTRCGSGSNKCLDGAAAVAGFIAPNALAFLDGTLYIADDIRIRKLTPQGEVKTVCGGEFPGLLDDTKDRDVPAMMKPSFGMVADAGVIYFSQDHAVRRFNPANGLLTTMCGGGTRGSEDEIGVRARFSSPGGIFLYGDGARGGMRGGSSAPGTPLASPAATPRGVAAPPPLALPSTASTSSTTTTIAASSGRTTGEVKTPLLSDARKSAEPTVWLLVADTLNHSIRRVALSGTPTPASRLATDALDSDIKPKPKLDNQRNRCCCSGSS